MALPPGFRCTKCGSDQVVRNGYNRLGTPQYKCKSCGTCRVIKRKRPPVEVDEEAIARCYRERLSLRAVGRIFGISHTHVSKILKKKQSH